MEVLLQTVWRRRSPLVVFHHDAEASLAQRFYAVLTAKSGYAMPPAGNAAGTQDPPRLVRAISFARSHMQGANAQQKLSVCQDAAALRPIQPFVEAAARNAQGRTKARDPEPLPMPSDEGVLHGSSRAKYATAFFKMSRSSVTFASSRLRRATSLS